MYVFFIHVASTVEETKTDNFFHLNSLSVFFDEILANTQ